MFAKVELMSLYGAAGTLELVLGALLILGLFTRLAAFILSGEMAFAYFMGHMLKGETPVLLPLLNNGTARDPVLLRLPLSLGGRRRPDQRRCGDGQRTRLDRRRICATLTRRN